jgi:hypothetical protein
MLCNIFKNRFSNLLSSYFLKFQKSIMFDKFLNGKKQEERNGNVKWKIAGAYFFELYTVNNHVFFFFMIIHYHEC